MPEELLLKVRNLLVDKVSEPVLNQLLDKLLQLGIINDEEMESVTRETKSNKARAVIDMVRRKGPQPSSVLIDHIRMLDPHLSKTLLLS